MKNLTNQQNNYTFLPDKTSSLGKQIKLSVVVSIFFRQKKIEKQVYKLSNKGKRQDPTTVTLRKNGVKEIFVCRHAFELFKLQLFKIRDIHVVYLRAKLAFSQLDGKAFFTVLARHLSWWRRRTSKRKSMEFNRFCIKSVKETGTKQECYYSSYVINLKWTNYVSVCTSVKSYMRVHAYLCKVLSFISKRQQINDSI